MAKPDPTAFGRYAYDGIDRVLHEKARLGILTSLTANADGLPFNELKNLCGLTDGNLSRHLQVLSDAGLVEMHKTTEGRRPQTRCHLTPQGRERFLAYVMVLERIVQDAIAENQSTPVRDDTCHPHKWASALKTQF